MYDELTEILGPLVQTNAERLALLAEGLSGHSIIYEIAVDGSTRVFIVNMARTLLECGELEPGIPALWGLLQVVRPRVGIEKQALIDSLEYLIRNTSRTVHAQSVAVQTVGAAPLLWDAGLLPKQRDAASHWGNSARVLAGPGSGKTRTLAHRVAFLVQERKLSPKSITVITFTRAAARELEQRLKSFLPNLGVSSPNVSTIHSFALRTLRRFRFASGLLQDLRVADDFEEDEIILPEIARLIARTPTEAEKALAAYAAIWDTLNKEHQQWQSVTFQIEFEDALKDLKEFYGFLLRGELVVRLTEFFGGNPVVAEKLGIQHLLVDEFQDLNPCEQKAVAQIEGFDAHLFVVGDDDQSIYGFRHAEPEGIRQFVSQRTDVGCGDYDLDICRRCPSRILAHAETLIQHDKKRIPKNLVSQSRVNGAVFALQFKSNKAEEGGIAKICRAYVNAGWVQPSEISILLCRKSLAAPITASLDRCGLPTTNLSPLSPLDAVEIDPHRIGRQFYCVLRLLVDQYDALAARTWLGLQHGIGAKALDDLRKYCIAQNLSYWDGLASIANDPGQLPRLGTRLKEECASLQAQLATLARLGSLQEILDVLVGSENQSDAVKAEVRRFLNKVIADRQAGTLRDLLTELQTYQINVEESLSENAIRVMTMHKAKGLASKLVIIPALEQDLMPGDFDEAEARRMMYVSVTRSEHILIMTHAWSRHGTQSYMGSGGGRTNRQRSQYLGEMGIASAPASKFIQDLPGRLKSGRM